jgi:hypothetical protein
VAKSSKPGSKKKQSSPTRSKSKTKAAAPRKAKGKAKGKKAASRPYGAGTGENVIELRPIRERLQANVAALGAAIGSRKDAQPDLEEALKRMSRWLDDIQDICGPDMAIPLS